jgi:hypothetical protein
MTYKQSHDHQLNEWVKGISIHNNDASIKIVDDNDNVIRTVEIKGGECCPDFSCCKPQLGWSLELRQKFMDSDENTRQNMMFSMALPALLMDANIDPKDVSVLTGINESKSLN